MADSETQSMLLHISERLVEIERLIQRLAKDGAFASPENCWVDSKEFCKLVGLSNTKALSYQLQKGVIHGNAIRNVGTPQRPIYRFHRKHAVDQFLNRTHKNSPAT